MSSGNEIFCPEKFVSMGNRYLAARLRMDTNAELELNELILNPAHKIISFPNSLRRRKWPQRLHRGGRALRQLDAFLKFDVEFVQRGGRPSGYS